MITVASARRPAKRAPGSDSCDNDGPKRVEGCRTGVRRAGVPQAGITASGGKAPAVTFETSFFQRHLLPLSSPPTGPGWNRDMLAALAMPAAEAEAAVLLAIRDAAAGPEVLFTRRSDSLTHHGGQISFPGGRADPGDRDAVATALREAEEEIALPRSEVLPLGFLDRLETVSGFRVTPVVGRVTGQPVLTANPGEVAEVFAVPLDYLLNPRNYQRRFIRAAGTRHAVSEIRYHDWTIWGATAMILLNLQQRLGITT